MLAWDIVVVPFPYPERLAEKRRPALIVSGENLHRTGYLWIAMITRTGKALVAGDIVIDEWEAAGLPVASMVRTSKIATVEPDRIVRRIGSLRDRHRSAVRKAITAFLAG